MLIAVAGLAGVGKTTTVEYLESGGIGRQVYVGRYIQEERSMKTHHCDVCGCDTDEGINARATVQLERTIQLHITANVDGVDICDECAVKAFDFYRNLSSAQLKHPNDVRQLQIEHENKRLNRALDFALNNIDFSRNALRAGVEKILMGRE